MKRWSCPRLRVEEMVRLHLQLGSRGDRRPPAWRNETVVHPLYPRKVSVETTSQERCWGHKARRDSERAAARPRLISGPTQIGTQAQGPAYQIEDAPRNARHARAQRRYRCSSSHTLTGPPHEPGQTRCRSAGSPTRDFAVLKKGSRTGGRASLSTSQRESRVTRQRKRGGK